MKSSGDDSNVSHADNSSNDNGRDSVNNMAQGLQFDRPMSLAEAMVARQRQMGPPPASTFLAFCTAMNNGGFLVGHDRQSHRNPAAVIESVLRLADQVPSEEGLNNDESANGIDAPARTTSSSSDVSRSLLRLHDDGKNKQ